MRSKVFAHLCFVLTIAPGTVIAQQSLAKVAQYRITDLGTLPGGNFSQATFVTNSRLVTGLSTGADGTQHAVAWSGGAIFDLGSPLGGPNSGANGANDAG